MVLHESLTCSKMKLGTRLAPNADSSSPSRELQRLGSRSRAPTRELATTDIVVLLHFESIAINHNFSRVPEYVAGYHNHASSQDIFGHICCCNSASSSHCLVYVHMAKRMEILVDLLDPIGNMGHLPLAGLSKASEPFATFAWSKERLLVYRPIHSTDSCNQR